MSELCSSRRFYTTRIWTCNALRDKRLRPFEFLDPRGLFLAPASAVRADAYPRLEPPGHFAVSLKRRQLW